MNVEEAEGVTGDGGQEDVGLDVAVHVVVAVRLQRRPGAADGLEAGTDSMDQLLLNFQIKLNRVKFMYNNDF
jgi:hypothetical protein